MKDLKLPHLTIKSATRASEQMITCSENPNFYNLLFALDLAGESI